MADEGASSAAASTTMPTAEASEFNNAVKKQIEFYFSDSNFPNDKFLRGKAAKDADGWVGLDVLLTFKRMQEILAKHPAAKENKDALADALDGSVVVETSEDKQRVRRLHPLPDEDVSLQQSLYLKGFPVELTQAQLEAWAEKTFGEVNAVRMRRVFGNERKFKGSIFLELPSKTVMEQWLDKDVEYDGKKLKVMAKDAYLKMKRDEATARKEKRKAKRVGDKDSDKNGTSANADAAGEDGDADQANDAAPQEPQYESGLILKFSGVGEGCTREDLKAAFGAYGGNVAYADFSRGQTDGYLRFESADVAAAAAKGVAENNVKLAGQVPSVTILEGDEEKQYWQHTADMKAAAIERRSSTSRGGGRGGRGGRRGGFGGKRGGRGDAGHGGRGGASKKRARDDDGHAGGSKKAKTDDE